MDLGKPLRQRLCKSTSVSHPCFDEASNIKEAAGTTCSGRRQLVRFGGTKRRALAGSRANVSRKMTEKFYGVGILSPCPRYLPFQFTCRLVQMIGDAAVIFQLQLRSA